MGRKKKHAPPTKEEIERLKRLEEKEETQRKLMELGMGYTEEEIPPDEIDQSMVDKGIWHTIKSMIPYTNAYYEAQAAMEELDDYHQIRVDIARAAELVSKSRVGRHEEALEEMMSETNHDFFYFNKIKHNQTVEGKWKYVPPKLDPFRYLERGGNRLRKAVGMQFAILDEAVMRKLAVHGRLLGDKVKTIQLDKDENCNWKGRNDDGEDLECLNMRMSHPNRFVQNKRGEDIPEVLPHCPFHSLHCVGKHDSDPPRIRVPNAEALCNECYMLKFKTIPPKFSIFTAPGVVQAIDKKETKGGEKAGSIASLSDKGELHEELSEQTYCCWRPSPEESLTRMRGYICRNHVYRNPYTKALMRTCAMHIKSCIRQHATATDAIIEIPNVYGLCTMHYIAEMGAAPMEIPFPYPGMQHRMRNKGWMVKAGHFAAPSWPPTHAIICNGDVPEKEKPVGYLNQMRELARVIAFKKKRKALGPTAALKIQTYFRMYRVKGNHKQALRQRRKPIRTLSAIRIQCLMRRYLARKRYLFRYHAYSKATFILQRVYRGAYTRKLILRHKAALYLQKQMKKWKSKRFYNAVMLVIKLKQVFNKRIAAMALLQRVARGYIERKRVLRKKRAIHRRFERACNVIKFAYHTYIKKKNAWALALSQTSDGLNRYEVARQLVAMIEELYFVRRERRVLLSLMMRASPKLRRVMRRFFRRHPSERVINLCNSLLKLSGYQISTADVCSVSTEIRPLSSSTRSMSSVHDEPLYSARDMLKNHVPPYYRHGHILDQPAMEAMFLSWYKMHGLPYLTGEIASIYKQFRDPMDGKVDLNRLQDYVDMHKYPCHKHSRYICGDCVFYRECFFGPCKCSMFRKDARTGFMCVGCNHPHQYHKLCPVQIKPKKNKHMSLAATLHYFMDPDMSCPISFQGVQMDDVVKEVTRVGNANMHENQTRMLMQSASGPPPSQTTDETDGRKASAVTGISALTVSSPSSTAKKKVSLLDTQLAKCERAGDTLQKEDEYWEHRTPHLLTNYSVHEAYLAVNASIVPPATDLSEKEFWVAAQRIPNKSVRDYHEKFEHSMPLPIAKDGEIIYTLEGAKVYLELLRRIVQLHEEDPRHGIDMDSGDLLRLVVDHVQIFERHWRKMVVDIRTGVVNRHIRIDEGLKLLYAGTLMPRPALAEKLDKAFRDLGFHMKVLGKDIQLRSYAERKKPKPKSDRRPSFPGEALGSAGSMSGSLTGTMDSTRSIASPSRLGAVPIGTATKPVSIRRAESMPVEEHAIQDPSRLARSTPAPVTPPRHVSKVKALVSATMSGIKAVEELKEKEKLKSELGPTRRNRLLDKRGSESDLLRPTSVQDIQTTKYSILTTSRAKYDELVTADGRYICPFPACGASFMNQQAAFDHLSAHEQRNRLFASTALADSHLNYYWPRGAPWREAQKYVKRAIPPGAVKCTAPGCNMVFPSQHRLAYHIRWMHATTKETDIMKLFFKPVGKPLVVVPPLEPPSYAPINYCSQHKYIDERCATCREFDRSDHPKQPYVYHSAMKLDFNLRFGAGGEVLIARQGSDNALAYDHMEDDGTLVHCKGKPVAMMKDQRGDGWVAVRQLLTHDEALQCHVSVPRDYDFKYELLMRPDTVPPVWIRVADITGRIFLMEIPKIDFKHKIKNNLIPTENVYFVRPPPDEVVATPTPQKGLASKKKAKKAI